MKYTVFIDRERVAQFANVKHAAAFAELFKGGEIEIFDDATGKIVWYRR